MAITLNQDPNVGLSEKQVPIVYSRDVQLEPGPPSSFFALARGRDLAILHHISVPFVSLERLPSRDWIAFLIPLSWDRICLINGVQAERGVVHLVQGRNGFVSSARHRVVTTLGFHRNRFLQVCAAIGGVDVDDLSLQDCLLKFDDRQFKLLVTRLHSVLATQDWTTQDFSTLSLPARVEDDLFNELAHAFYPKLFDHKGRLSGPPSAVKLVYEARQAIDQHGPSSITTSDLCQILGVGYSRLHVVFQDIFGESPHRYLLRMRLSEARRMFFDSETPPRSVKDVALGVGFTKSGRFAERYLELFGEYPSQTLARVSDVE